MSAPTRRLAAGLIFSTVIGVSAHAQQIPLVTAADYARAERFLRDNVMPLVSGIGVEPSWLGGERFWYRRSTMGGADLIVVDPTRALRSVCTPDTERCGAAIDPREAARARAEFGQRGRAMVPEVLSPDGKRSAFIRAYNLWVRDVATGRETQLTTDGIKEFGYATDNAGWIRSDNPILLWSPDSRKIATFQQDERGVGEMYLVNTKVGHPDLQA
jgi:dipeptidyl-peptidase-4